MSNGFLDRLALSSPYGDEQGVLMVAAHTPGGLKAFFDESGIHDRADICVIAGYIGSLNEWRRFDAAWGPYANAPGFHAKSFFAHDDKGQRVSPYTGWSDAQARAYLDRLLDSITSFKLEPVGALVDVRAFRQYTEDERRYMTGGSTTARGTWVHSGAPTKPYYVAFWKAVTEAIDQLGRDDWKVEFVFDQQHTFAPLALRLFTRLKNELGGRYSLCMGGAIFESRHVAIGLQVADLIAYCWYQFGLHGHGARAEVHRVLSAQRKNTLVAFTKDMMDKLVGRREATAGKTYEYDPHSHTFQSESKGEDNRS